MIWEAWKEMDGMLCRAQPKFDGLYVQIHKQGDIVHVFGREALSGPRWLASEQLADISTALPDIGHVLNEQVSAQSFILEGELVGFHEDKKTVVLFADTLYAYEHRIYVYDMLYLNGIDLRSARYIDRRRMLESLIGSDKSYGQKQTSLMLAPETNITSFKDLVAFLDLVITHPYCEGVVLKNGLKPYNAGRESLGRGKLKNYLSLDAVVLGYNQRQGKPTSLLIGLWDQDEPGPDARLVPVATVESVKAGEKLWAELLAGMRSLTRRARPGQVLPGERPDRWVEPRIVVEVGCDGQRVIDPRYYPLGYTFRDKTFLRLRREKGIFAADTVHDFMQLNLAPGEDRPDHKNAESPPHEAAPDQGPQSTI